MARTAEVKRDARIGEAEAKRDAQIKEAIAEEERMASRYSRKWGRGGGGSLGNIVESQDEDCKLF